MRTTTRQRSERRAKTKHPLVDLYFHIWGEDLTIARRGRVLKAIKGERFLVVWFHGIDGRESAYSVVDSDSMTLRDVNGDRQAGIWQFYPDAASLDHWVEHEAPKVCAKRAKSKQEIDLTPISRIRR